MTQETETSTPELIDPAPTALPSMAQSERPGTPDGPSVDIAAVRELVLRAHPQVVPELVIGETVDALLASIEPAEAAYRRISEALNDSDTASSRETPPVPAGGDRPMPVDQDRIPASEKIRRGLSRR